MDRDRIIGASKEFAGKVEGAAGDLAGNARMEASGRAREAAGTVQNFYGQAKDSKKGTEAVQIDAKTVASTVRDNPLGSLLIAGGIGFALAVIIARPARRRYYE